MAIINLFSKRKRQAAQEERLAPFAYDLLPKPFRNQVLHIWKDAIGPFFEPGEYDDHYAFQTNNEAWDFIHRTICREAGLMRLGDGDPFEQCKSYLQNAVTDSALDIIELSFKYIEVFIGKMQSYQLQNYGIKQDPKDAVDELNQRFLEHGVGYQFLDGKIIRMDSQFLHKETTVRAIQLIRDAGYLGPEEEFMRGLEHFRHGRQKEALVEALKALESTMKCICDRKSWKYSENATSKELIGIVFSRGLVSSELQSQFTALRSTLESGVPTVRNRKGAHGQGSEVVAVPAHVTGYVLHMTASAIVFLVEAARA